MIGKVFDQKKKSISCKSQLTHCKFRQAKGIREVPASPCCSRRAMINLNGAEVSCLKDVSISCCCHTEEAPNSYSLCISVHVWHHDRGAKS